MPKYEKYVMTTEEHLLKIPVIKWFVKLFKKIELPALEGLSLYDVLELYVIGIFKGALTSRASSIAFSFFMALFPFALFILTLIPYVPVENFDNIFMEFIAQILPPDTYEAVDSVLKDIAKNKYSGLLSFGLLMSMFLMTNGVNALFGGFEYTYHKLETRSLIKQYLIALCISLLIVFILITTVVSLIYYEIAVGNLTQSGYLPDNKFLTNLGRYAIVVAMLFLTIAIFYYFGTKEGNKISFFSIGAMLTTFLIIISFKIFGIYIAEFAQYNELYGSIGTLLILMLFIYLNSIIILLGYELNAAIIKLKNRKI